MKKAMRIWYDNYYDDQVFETHLDAVRKNLDVIDEITMFADYSHYGYWSPEFTGESAALLTRRIAQYKEAGVSRVGINILCTIGHIDESWDVLPKTNLQHIVGPDGRESKACLCPSGEDFLSYVADRYAAYARTGADFIWIDDDLRIENHHVSELCYCPNCIRKFNEEYGTDYDFDSLTRELRAEGYFSDTVIPGVYFDHKKLVGNIQTKPLQKKWDEFRNNIMLRLCAAIKDAIKQANPAVEIGYMCGEFAAYADWIEASGSTMARPGGGPYNDHSPVEYFVRPCTVMKQISLFPSSIKEIQYEYESFIFQRMERSLRMTDLESAWALIAGCDGILYNQPFICEQQDTMELFRSRRQKWDKLTELNKGCKNAGIYYINSHTAYLLGQVGIPMTPYLEFATAAIILGKDWNQLTDEEVSRVLDLNVFTDGKGLAILHERGFGSRCGASVKQIYTNGMAERFTDHEINAGYAGNYRNIFMNFYPNDGAFELEPTAGVETISMMETISHKPVGCSMYRYEAPGGQRFAADGYFMPENLQINREAKKVQLNNLFDWLSNGQMAVKTDSKLKVIPIVMKNEEGGMNIMLANAHFDNTGAFTCTVRGSGEFALISDSGELTKVVQTAENGVCKIEIDNMEPWSYLLLTNQK